MSTLATNAITDASGGNTTTINGYTPTVSNMAGRNRLINSDMRIDQRNAGASVTPTDGQYTVDRWQARLNQSSKFSVQQNAGSVTPPEGYTNYLGVTSLSSYSVLSTDYFAVQQNIEGFNTADLNWGTANAKAITVSFWVRSSLTGTFPLTFLNDGFARAYVTTYTVSAANTWEYKTVTISGDTTGTWTTNNSAGLRLWFTIGAGSAQVPTPDAWGSFLGMGAAGAVNVVGTSGATWYITGVQLEVGSVATPFEHRQYGQELALCQRYYEKTYDITTAPATATDTGRMNYSASSEGNGNFITDINYKVSKRAAPTLTAYVGGGTSGIWTYEKSGASGTNSVTFDLIGQSHARAYVSIGSNWTACYVYGHWTASAEL
jgi:hypothetical protein